MGFVRTRRRSKRDFENLGGEICKKQKKKAWRQPWPSLISTNPPRLRASLIKPSEGLVVGPNVIFQKNSKGLNGNYLGAKRKFKEI